jgi:SAM-dependent methyltransferase
MAIRPGAAGSQLSLNAEAPLTLNGWLRYDVISRMIPAGTADVLEIGCGRGAFGARLAQRYHYLGVEPDRASFEVAARRVAAAGRGEVRNIRVEELGAEQFDLVCAFEVLEHIEDDASAVKEWATRLRPGGHLLLSVPAHQRRFSAGDEIMGHFRRYDPPVMADLLAGCGFTGIDMRLYGFPLCYLLDGPRDLIRGRIAAVGNRSLAERTAASGRVLQPSGRRIGTLTQWGTAPFRATQRGFPALGTGLVVVARLAG